MLLFLMVFFFFLRSLYSSLNSLGFSRFSLVVKPRTEYSSLLSLASEWQDECGTSVLFFPVFLSIVFLSTAPHPSLSPHNKPHYVEDPHKFKNRCFRSFHLYWCLFGSSVPLYSILWYFVWLFITWILLSFKKPLLARCPGQLLLHGELLWYLVA